MGSPAIFSGKYTKLLTQNGLMNSDGSLNQYNGDKNYITYNNFENAATTGWSLFNTTISAGFIPNGSVNAGASTVTTFATTTTNPIAGSNSLQAASSSAWNLGQGFISDVFTLEREDLNKLLTINFSYEVSSGSGNADWGGVLGTQTFIVYVYNTTSSAWVQPSGYLSLNTSTGTGKFTGTFTSSSTVGQQYRIAIVASRNSTGAVTINFDNFFVGYVPPANIITGNLTESTSSVLTITGGSGSVVGSGTSIRVKEADYFQSGYISQNAYIDSRVRQPLSVVDYSIVVRAPSSITTAQNATTVSVSGTQAGNSINTLTLLNSISHISHTTTSTAGTIAGFRTGTNVLCLNNGFYTAHIFAINDGTLAPLARSFAGVANTSSVLPINTTTNTDPFRTVMTNFIGIGYDGFFGDTNLKIFHNGATVGATTVIDLGASWSFTPGDGIYQFQLWADVNTGIVYYDVINLYNLQRATGQISANIPTVTLNYHSVRSNGGSSLVCRWETASISMYAVG